jgi:hypothetical protein
MGCDMAASVRSPDGEGPFRCPAGRVRARSRTRPDGCVRAAVIQQRMPPASAGAGGSRHRGHDAVLRGEVVQAAGVGDTGLATAVGCCHPDGGAVCDTMRGWWR